MPIVTDIYRDYKIMPLLQQHQLRVAAVAEYISAHMTIPLKKDEVITACLLHDMGNIIKFIIPNQNFPQSFEPEGVAYWQAVQADYVARYGHNEHVASVMIAKEFNVSPEVIDYIVHVDFSMLEVNAATDVFERKVCSYADMRTAPYGIVSITERLADGYKRYKDRPELGITYEGREVLADSIYRTEEQLQAVCGFDLKSIDDDFIEPLIQNLENRTI